jgi:hypothetical protein
MMCGEVHDFRLCVLSHFGETVIHFLDYCQIKSDSLQSAWLRHALDFHSRQRFYRRPWCEASTCDCLIHKNRFFRVAKKQYFPPIDPIESHEVPLFRNNANSPQLPTQGLPDDY